MTNERVKVNADDNYKKVKKGIKFQKTKYPSISMQMGDSAN